MTAPAVSLPQLVAAAVESHRHRIGALLPVLHQIHEQLGYVPSDAVPLIAHALNLSRAEVHGVIAFYHDFRSEPPGKHVLQVCRSEACQAMGGRALARHVRERLGIDFGETTADRRFSLDAVYCLGNCACPPSLCIDGQLHARVCPDRFDALIGQLGEVG